MSITSSPKTAPLIGRLRSSSTAGRKASRPVLRLWCPRWFCGSRPPNVWHPFFLSVSVMYEIFVLQLLAHSVPSDFPEHPISFRLAYLTTACRRSGPRRHSLSSLRQYQVLRPATTAMKASYGSTAPATSSACTIAAKACRRFQARKNIVDRLGDEAEVYSSRHDMELAASDEEMRPTGGRCSWTSFEAARCRGRPLHLGASSLT